MTASARTRILDAAEACLRRDGIRRTLQWYRDHGWI